MILAPKVMGRLAAAVEHHSEFGNGEAEVFKEQKRGCHAAAGQIAPREKNRCTARRDALPGEEFGAATIFVAEDGAIFRLFKEAACHVCSSQVEKKFSRIKFFRADRGTKPAEATFKSHCPGCGLGEIETLGDCLGCAVMGQKGAVSEARPTFTAAIFNFVELAGGRFWKVRRFDLRPLPLAACCP